MVLMDDCDVIDPNDVFHTNESVSKHPILRFSPKNRKTYIAGHIHTYILQKKNTGTL